MFYPLIYIIYIIYVYINNGSHCISIYKLLTFISNQSIPQCIVHRQFDRAINNAVTSYISINFHFSHDKTPFKITLYLSSSP